MQIGASGMPAPSERKLAAVMFADVAGFSALMERSETTTFSRLRRLREEVCTPAIEAHQGRLVKSTGDGFLAEFNSASAAVRAALQIQSDCVGLESSYIAEDRIRFRIGINMGEVIVDGDDLAGDGVNVAARLESLSPVDGLCISSPVYDQLRDGAERLFVDRGEQKLKNISRSVRVFTSSAGSHTSMGNASEVELASHRPGLRRLSFLVLPFANVSGDHQKDYFADGITDDITSQLSKIKSSHVVGRDTAFSYRGRAIDVKAIGNELGVRYVLQGEVEMLDEGVDVRVWLNDSVTGERVWADTIEVHRSAARSIRREIVTRLAVAMNLTLVRVEASRSLRENPDNADAVDLVMRGWAAWHRGATLENIDEAQRLLTRALDVQPQYQPALAGLAELVAMRALSWPGGQSEADILQAENYAHQAIELDGEDASARHAMARVHLQQDRLAAAVAENDIALELDPNCVSARAFKGLMMLRTGAPELALEPITTALAQSPKDPLRWSWINWMGYSLISMGRHKDAVTWLEKSAALAPDSMWALANLMVAQLGAGNLTRAQEIKGRLLALRPTFSIGYVRRVLVSSDESYLHLRDEHYIAPLRQLGIPET